MDGRKTEYREDISQKLLRLTLCVLSGLLGFVLVLFSVVVSLLEQLFPKHTMWTIVREARSLPLPVIPDTPEARQATTNMLNNWAKYG